MKWVKGLLVLSLAVLQFAGCSMNESEENHSVARMQNVRGLKSDVTSGITDLLSTTNDWGIFYNQNYVSNWAGYRQLVYNMIYTGSSALTLGNVDPYPVNSSNTSGVFFKGRMRSSQGLTLNTNAAAYLESLKTDTSYMQLLVQVWDDLVGTYQAGALTVDPYSLYFGRLSTGSGYYGKMGFNYAVDSSGSYQFILQAKDDYGTLSLQGVIGGQYTQGTVSYTSSSGTAVTIGNLYVATCNFFICS